MLIENESLRGESSTVIRPLRDAGKAVEFSPAQVKGDKQFKRALGLAAKFTLRVDRGETGSFQYRVKDLAARHEQLVRVAGVAAWVETL